MRKKVERGIRRLEKVLGFASRMFLYLSFTAEFSREFLGKILSRRGREMEAKEGLDGKKEHRKMVEEGKDCSEEGFATSYLGVSVTGKEEGN